MTNRKNSNTTKLLYLIGFHWQAHEDLRKEMAIPKKKLQGVIQNIEIAYGLRFEKKREGKNAFIRVAAGQREQLDESYLKAGGQEIF